MNAKRFSSQCLKFDPELKQFSRNTYNDPLDRSDRAALVCFDRELAPCKRFHCNLHYVAVSDCVNAITPTAMICNPNKQTVSLCFWPAPSALFVAIGGGLRCSRVSSSHRVKPPEGQARDFRRRSPIRDSNYDYIHIALGMGFKQRRCQQPSNLKPSKLRTTRTILLVCDGGRTMKSP